MKTHIFLQSEALDDIAVVEIDAGSSADEVRKTCLALLPEGLSVDEFQMFLEDDDDAAPTLEGKIADGLRVHLHRLKAIDVHVRYAGRSVHRTFRPSATVRRVKRWAVRELGISPLDAKELMLQVAGTDHRPDDDVHIGSLAKPPCSSLTFDLVPSPRING